MTKKEKLAGKVKVTRTLGAGNNATLEYEIITKENPGHTETTFFKTSKINVSISFLKSEVEMYSGSWNVREKASSIFRMFHTI
jgi:hypothetical protein